METTGKPQKQEDQIKICQTTSKKKFFNILWTDEINLYQSDECGEGQEELMIQNTAPRQ